MKFGLVYLFSDFGHIAQDRLFDEVLEEITYAEELDHFAVYGMLGNPMIFAASVAERTRRMKKARTHRRAEDVRGRLGHRPHLPSALVTRLSSSIVPWALPA